MPVRSFFFSLKTKKGKQEYLDGKFEKYTETSKGIHSVAKALDKDLSQNEKEQLESIEKRIRMALYNGAEVKKEVQKQDTSGPEEQKESASKQEETAEKKQVVTQPNINENVQLPVKDQVETKPIIIDEKTRLAVDIIVSRWIRAEESRDKKTAAKSKELLKPLLSDDVAVTGYLHNLMTRTGRKGFSSEKEKYEKSEKILQFVAEQPKYKYHGMGEKELGECLERYVDKFIDQYNHDKANIDIAIIENITNAIQIGANATPYSNLFDTFVEVGTKADKIVGERLQSELRLGCKKAYFPREELQNKFLGTLSQEVLKSGVPFEVRNKFSTYAALYPVAKDQETYAQNSKKELVKTYESLLWEKLGTNQIKTFGSVGKPAYPLYVTNMAVILQDRGTNDCEELEGQAKNFLTGTLKMGQSLADTLVAGLADTHPTLLMVLGDVHSSIAFADYHLILTQAEQFKQYDPDFASNYQKRNQTTLTAKHRMEELLHSVDGNVEQWLKNNKHALVSLEFGIIDAVQADLTLLENYNQKHNPKASRASLEKCNNRHSELSKLKQELQTSINIEGELELNKAFQEVVNGIQKDAKKSTPVQNQKLLNENKNFVRKRVGVPRNAKNGDAPETYPKNKQEQGSRIVTRKLNDDEISPRPTDLNRDSLGRVDSKPMTTQDLDAELNALVQNRQGSPVQNQQQSINGDAKVGGPRQRAGVPKGAAIVTPKKVGLRRTLSSPSPNTIGKTAFAEYLYLKEEIENELGSPDKKELENEPNSPEKPNNNQFIRRTSSPAAIKVTKRTASVDDRTIWEALLVKRAIGQLDNALNLSDVEKIGFEQGVRDLIDNKKGVDNDKLFVAVSNWVQDEINNEELRLKGLLDQELLAKCEQYLKDTGKADLTVEGRDLLVEKASKTIDEFWDIAKNKGEAQNYIEVYQATKEQVEQYFQTAREQPVTQTTTTSQSITVDSDSSTVSDTTSVSESSSSLEEPNVQDQVGNVSNDGTDVPSPVTNVQRTTSQPKITDKNVMVGSGRTKYNPQIGKLLLDSPLQEGPQVNILPKPDREKKLEESRKAFKAEKELLKVEAARKAEEEAAKTQGILGATQATLATTKPQSQKPDATYTRNAHRIELVAMQKAAAERKAQEAQSPEKTKEEQEAEETARLERIKKRDAMLKAAVQKDPDDLGSEDEELLHGVYSIRAEKIKAELAVLKEKNAVQNNRNAISEGLGNVFNKKFNEIKTRQPEVVAENNSDIAVKSIQLKPIIRENPYTAEHIARATAIYFAEIPGNREKLSQKPQWKEKMVDVLLPRIEVIIAAEKEALCQKKLEEGIHQEALDKNPPVPELSVVVAKLIEENGILLKGAQSSTKDISKAITNYAVEIKNGLTLEKMRDIRQQDTKIDAQRKEYTAGDNAYIEGHVRIDIRKRGEKLEQSLGGLLQRQNNLDPRKPHAPTQKAPTIGEVVDHYIQLKYPKPVQPVTRTTRKNEYTGSATKINPNIAWFTNGEKITKQLAWDLKERDAFRLRSLPVGGARKQVALETIQNAIVKSEIQEIKGKYNIEPKEEGITKIKDIVGNRLKQAFDRAENLPTVGQLFDKLSSKLQEKKQGALNNLKRMCPSTKDLEVNEIEGLKIGDRVIDQVPKDKIVQAITQTFTQGKMTTQDLEGNNAQKHSFVMFGIATKVDEAYEKARPCPQPQKRNGVLGI